MLQAALALAMFLSAQYLADLQVEPLAFDAGSLREAFNARAELPRLVTVMSPT